MTSKEKVKVYLSKQIAMCEEKIELYENVKASKDFIELHKNLLDFYKTIKKDLEALEILKKHIYFSSKSGCIRMKDIYKSINNFDYEDLREWVDNDN